MSTIPPQIGRFRVLSVLGRGAMGVVYRARDESLDRDVAVKVMALGPGADADSRARFLREARAVARLQHPNIVTIYELGEHEASPFMAMELLEGVDLQRAIEEGLRPDPKVTLPIVLQLLAGLGHAHDNGIVHRDVKPSNIFLPRARPAKIMDFGVARLAGGMTTAGQVVGTPNYMSPEQVRGETVDGRSDVFSAGLILYELVTGEKAYRGDTVIALLFKIAHQAPDLSLIPRGPEWERLRGILARALARDAAARYPDARAMAAELSLALLEVGGSTDWAAASDQGLMVRTPKPSPVPVFDGGGEDAGGPAAPAGPGPVAPSATPGPAVPSPHRAPAAPAARAVSWVPAAALGAATLLAIAAVALFLSRRGPGGPPAPVATPRAGASPTPAASPTPGPALSAAAAPASSTPTPAAIPRSQPPAARTRDEAAPAPQPPAPAADSDAGGGAAEPALAVQPAPADARLERANQLFEQGRFGAALAEARAVLKREPGNADAKDLMEDAEVEIVVAARVKEASAALKRGDREAAMAAARAGLQVKPTDARLIALWRELTQ